MSTIYTSKELCYINKLYDEGYYHIDITRKTNAKFGNERTLFAIQKVCSRMGFTKGWDNPYKKGKD